MVKCPCFRALKKVKDPSFSKGLEEKTFTPEF